MKTKIVLTVLLIIGCFWAAIHFAEKKQKDQQALLDLQEKYKNNYDSIYLSDLQIYYKDKPVKLYDSFSNWDKLFGDFRDSSKNILNFSKLDHMPLLLDKVDSLYMLVAIHLYDVTSFKVKFPKEDVVVEAYQKYSDYIKQYSKSRIHSKEIHTGRRSALQTLTIYNTDTLSNVGAIALMFDHGQMMQLNIITKGQLALEPRD